MIRGMACFGAVISVCLVPMLCYAGDSPTLLLSTYAVAPEGSEFADETNEILIRRLQDAGVDVRLHSGPPETRTAAKLRREAEQASVDFFAVNILSVDGDDITIDTELYETPGGRRLFITRSTGSAELDMERKLGFISDRIARIAFEEMHQGASPVPADAPPPQEDPTGEVASEQEPNLSTESEAGSRATPLPPASDGQGTGRSDHRWSIGAGISGIFPVGESGDYLSSGIRAGLDVALRIPIGAIILEPGIRLDFGRVHAEGYIRSTGFLMAGAGAGMRLRIPTGGTWQPYIGIWGGSDVAAVRKDDDSWMGKPLPWMVLDGGTGYRLNRAFGIDAGLEVRLAFEPSLVILTLEPRLGGRYSW